MLIWISVLTVWRLAGGVPINGPQLFNRGKWIDITSGSVKWKPSPVSPSFKDPQAQIFVSIADYRDEKCPETLKSLFENAKNPSRVFVGELSPTCSVCCINNMHR
jgi:hypothetical protein